MADHLASVFHIPSPNNPYTKATGATFATAEATVMSTPFFVERGIQPPPSYNSLDTQIKSFTQLLNTICGSPNECAKKLRRTLLFVDQIGTNEYKYAFFPRQIHKGGVQLCPTSCGGYQEYDQEFHQSRSHSSDRPREPTEWGLNTFTRLHNDHLRQALEELRTEFPGVEIVYGDYYNAFMAILRNHDILGFKKGSLMKACCGFGGPYNFHPEKMCGDGGLGSARILPKFKFPEVMHCIM
ncbi:hypothetical protein Acr_10g0004220 [Actinidia rufa]|uniref:GDSL-like Lipase/Acylhydrolase superfamily protein n=1 Tax=Actinidia rufa TaxID=165716 RepID=A0A7J0FAW3_9ERIC|nr:hypothetical protein Acr_10g0004220 [Actinidia rufa]